MKGLLKILGFSSNKVSPKWQKEGFCKNTIFCIGDIHGRIDLFENILEKISSKINASKINDSNEKPIIILLGDYIDRGNSSKAIIEKMIEISKNKLNNEISQLICIMGNHEKALLDFIDNSEKGPNWCRFGGDAALASYGVKAPSYNAPLSDWENCKKEFLQKLPKEHLEFIKSLHYFYIIDNLFFVHAGVSPYNNINNQNIDDMLTIRDEFINNNDYYEYYIVHGHTPSEDVIINNNRLALDTGAYATGKLSCAIIKNSNISIINT